MFIPPAENLCIGLIGPMGPIGPLFMMLPAQLFISTQSDGIVSFISQDAAPEAFRSPDARAQGFELNDLTVVYEEIHLRAVVLDVRSEERRVGKECRSWGVVYG